MKLTDMPTVQLQQRLEELQSGSCDPVDLPSDLSSLQELMHELQVHQIELEMQNRELHESQRQLEAARDHYADLYDFAPVGYLDFDGQGRVMQANMKALELLGAKLLTLVRRPFIAWIDKASMPLFHNHLKQVMKGLSAECQLRLSGHAPSERLVRLESIPVWEHNAIKACRSVLEDITEQVTTAKMLREQHEKLMLAERLSQLGELSSAIAHELNQPLSALLSYAQTGEKIVKSGNIDNERLLDLCGKIVAQAEQGGAILKRISQFTRKSKMMPQYINLNEIIAETVVLAELRAREQQITIRQVLTPGLPKTMADPVEIQQVLLNLLINGIEAISSSDQARGYISIESQRSDRHNMLECCVTDSGPGLTEEQVAQLFKPLYTSKRDGMGLGLVISRSIIERHGGGLRYARRQDGHTQFCFSLPVRGEVNAN